MHGTITSRFLTAREAHIDCFGCLSCSCYLSCSGRLSCLARLARARLARTRRRCRRASLRIWIAGRRRRCVRRRAVRCGARVEGLHGHSNVFDGLHLRLVSRHRRQPLLHEFVRRRHLHECARMWQHLVERWRIALLVAVQLGRIETLILLYGPPGDLPREQVVRRTQYAVQLSPVLTPDSAQEAMPLAQVRQRVGEHLWEHLDLRDAAFPDVDDEGVLRL
mmetsp:Transcript_14203/g.36826  ORF Transcript_14203/g.36826 Transcript_14203/m.36826 type:complete len:221 (-) Transcript_14203:88-750(-)